MGIDILQYTLTSVFEIIIFYIACYNIFSKKTNNKHLNYAVSLFIIIITIYMSLGIENLFLKQSLVLITISLVMNIIFYNNKTNKIIGILTISMVVISIYLLLFAMDYLTVFLFKTLNEISVYEYIMSSDKSVFILALLSRAICLSIIIFFTRKKKGIVSLNAKLLFSFSLISFITIIGLIASIMPDNYSVIPKDYIIPFILIIINLFVYYIFIDLLKISDKMRIKSINEERFKDEIKFWKEMNEKDKVRRQMLHDYSETLFCIRTYLEEKRFDDLNNFVSKLSAKHKFASSFVKTGNTLFDILVNSKYEEAIGKNINFIMKLDNLENISIENEDLIFIMSNLINNAIEYVERLKSREKEIFLSVKNIEKYNVLEIIIRNSLEDKLYIEDGLIPTSKKGFNHGLGLLNVKEIIEKYSGESDIYVDDGYFTYIIKI